MKCICVIQRDIEDAISEKILMGELKDNESVRVDAEGEGILGEFTFKGVPFEDGDEDASGEREPELVRAQVSTSTEDDSDSDLAQPEQADSESSELPGSGSDGTPAQE